MGRLNSLRHAHVVPPKLCTPEGSTARGAIRGVITAPPGMLKHVGPKENSRLCRVPDTAPVESWSLTAVASEYHS